MRTWVKRGLVAVSIVVLAFMALVDYRQPGRNRVLLWVE